MLDISDVLQELFHELSEKVDADRQNQDQETILNTLTTLLPGIDRKTLIQIEHAIFISEMRAIEMACREAFVSGMNFL